MPKSNTVDGRNGKREYRYWRGTITYSDHEISSRVFKHHNKAERYAARQKKAPVVKKAAGSAVLPRGDVGEILHIGVRQGQRRVKELVKANVLLSDDSRSPLRIAFPATLAPQWMPGLFPEKPSE